MKFFVPVAVAAVAISSAIATTTSWIDALTKIPNTDSYHMQHVHMVHARAQSDAPVWIDSLSTFGSKYGGSTDAAKFRGALDTVNTASVEGALMYVQAEGIDYSKRGTTPDAKCNRKNWMQYIVFYDIVFAQTNETLAEYKSEYGPFLAMDGGQCTPISGTSVFSEECVSLNGNSSVPDLGPFIGGEPRDTDPRAPYPNCWWYSFPNSCPLQKWGTKDDTCRNTTRHGLCDFGTLPDGVTCTFNYRILGYVPVDDVVGITSMQFKNQSGNYSNFNQFCLDGGIEFETDANGTVVTSIDFWKDPTNTTANAIRAQTVIDTYTKLLSTTSSTQIPSATVTNMQALPVVSTLISANPQCYQNIVGCATATYGCKRDLYGQICTVCDSTTSGCVVAPKNFTFPTLTLDSIGGTSSGSSASNASTPTPTPTSTSTNTTKSSDAASLTMTVGALVASFGLSILMG